MNQITITPSPLTGSVRVPASKSFCHRAVICAALAKGRSLIKEVTFSEDIDATCEVMQSLGINILKEGNTLTIDGGSFSPKETMLNCHESGSTLRFAIPLAWYTGQKTTFVGAGRLSERPLSVYHEIMQRQKIAYEKSAKELPLTVKGKLHADRFHFDGNISSQFVTGLLFVLPLLSESSTVVLRPPVESVGYIDLTLQMLQNFGVTVEKVRDDLYHIAGGQNYLPKEVEIEGDYSQAAFWLAAGVLGQPVLVKGISSSSKQGDRAIVDILRQMGADLTETKEGILAKPSALKGVIIDASQCPDLVPILSVLGALAEGKTVIEKAERLRIKESDRLKAMCTELSKMGAKIKETADGLEIIGIPSLKGASCDSWNDHRIAMSIAIASIRTDGEITLTGGESVKKSYPHFWDHFTSLGGKIL